jgi:hypothetical protein
MLIHTEVVNLHYMRAGKRINSSEKLYCVWSRLHRTLGGTKRTNPLVSVHRKILECCCIDSGGRGTPCSLNLPKHVWWLECLQRKYAKIILISPPHFCFRLYELDSNYSLWTDFHRYLTERNPNRGLMRQFFLRTTKVRTNLESSMYQLLWFFNVRLANQSTVMVMAFSPKRRRVGDPWFNNLTSLVAYVDTFQFVVRLPRERLKTMVIWIFFPARFKVLIGVVDDFDLPGRYCVSYGKCLPMFRSIGPPSSVESSSPSLAP